MPDYLSSSGRGSGIRVRKIKFGGAVKKLRGIVPRVKKTAIQEVEQAARLGAISCAKSTQPYGTGEDAKNAGEHATANDIRRIYASPAAAFKAIQDTRPGVAAAFWAAIKGSQIDKALGILKSSGCVMNNAVIGLFDNGAVHKQRRNKRGRIPRSQEVELVVLDDKNLKAYTEIEIYRVGWGKAAWANVARAFGSIRGLAAGKTAAGLSDITAYWILRHTKSPFSIVKNYSNPLKPRITLTSLVPYATLILPEHERRKAELIADERLAKAMEIAAKAEARNAMKGPR